MKYGKVKKANGGKISSADIKEAQAIASDRGYQSPEDRAYATDLLQRARSQKKMAKGGKVMSRGAALRGFGKEVR